MASSLKDLQFPILSLESKFIRSSRENTKPDVDSSPNGFYLNLSEPDKEFVKSSLQKHGYVIFTDLCSELRIISSQAEEEAKRFFSCPNKVENVYKEPRIDGLPGWGIGYSIRKHRKKVKREMFHVYTDERVQANIPWPDKVFRKAMQDLYSILQHFSSKCFEIVENDFDLAKLDISPSQNSTPNPSVFDVFIYANVFGADIDCKQCQTSDNAESKLNDKTRSCICEDNMASHTDPGIFTVKVLSSVQGLQVFDLKHSEWIQLEDGRFPNSLVVFNCEQLEVGSQEKYKATSHLVSSARESRISLVYERRL